MVELVEGPFLSPSKLLLLTQRQVSEALNSISGSMLAAERLSRVELLVRTARDMKAFPKPGKSAGTTGLRPRLANGRQAAQQGLTRPGRVGR